MVQCLARHQSKGQEAVGMWVMSKSEAEMSFLDQMDDCYSQHCYSLLSPQLSATSYSQTSHHPTPKAFFLPTERKL